MQNPNYVISVWRVLLTKLQQTGLVVSKSQGKQQICLVMTNPKTLNTSRTTTTADKESRRKWLSRLRPYNQNMRIKLGRVIHVMITNFFYKFTIISCEICPQIQPYLDQFK